MKKEFFEEGGYEQCIKANGEIVCTCRWTTMEISRYPKDYKKRTPCKHMYMAMRKYMKEKNEISNSKKTT